jgi:hypothetical protein
MARITGYGAEGNPEPDDLLVDVDVHDTSMAATGTDKKETAEQVTATAVLWPSADTSGVTDSNAIDAAIGTYGHVLLAPGQWYVGAVGLTVSNRWLQGSGQSTIVNVVTGATGFLIIGATQLTISDMQFVIGSGSKAIGVTGASDYHGRDLWMTGSSAAGGILINGDSGLEQHWTDIVMRNVGGKAFDYERTTSTFTGSLYLDRVRIVTPPAGAFGFYFNSTAGSPSLNTAFLTECVADGFLEDACYVNNCAQLFMSGENWFAVGGSAAAGSVPVRITGGSYGVNISGGYLYNGLAAANFDIVVAGAAHDVTVGGGITFDGGSATTLLGLSAAGPGVFLGDHQRAFADGVFGAVTDTPYALTQMANQPLGDTAGPGEEIIPRQALTNIALATGVLYLSYFRAKKTEFIGHIETPVNTASSGATYSGMGLFTVSSTGLLTLVAKGEQTSGITLWTSAFEYIGGTGAINTRATLSANYLKRAGQLYAVGILFTGTTGPALPMMTNLTAGAGGMGFISGAPIDPLSASLSGQSTLGTIGTTTHTNASLSSYANQPYAVLET